MNKAGILTFIDTINFGASLQAFALQEVIESFGIRAEVIQYKNEGVEKQENNKGRISAKKILKSLVMGSALKRKKESFQQFEESNVHKGLVLDKDNAGSICDAYDYIISGSDQVWNMKITANDLTYFLDFVNNDAKKVTYAPSFGNVEFPPEHYEAAKELLARIPHLSVRERSGAAFIKDKFGLDARVVVDPTLLLSKDEWERRISFKPDFDHYILVYFPHNKKKVFDFVNKLKKKTRLPVVYLSISPKKQKGIKTIYDASPEEFLGWILHADYVVTGSFHGTAFSVNLEKQFYYETSGDGSRINNLVEVLGLENRSIEIDNSLEGQIDYPAVRKKLDAERSESKKWLKEALGI